MDTFPFIMISLSATFLLLTVLGRVRYSPIGTTVFVALFIVSLGFISWAFVSKPVQKMRSETTSEILVNGITVRFDQPVTVIYERKREGLSYQELIRVRTKKKQTSPVRLPMSGVHGK